MTDQTTFHATCHCKASRLSFTVPTSSLPLPIHFCHCSICRRTHGTLCVIHAPIPEPDVDLSSFTAYASSSYVVRYFCSTCGAHMFDKASEDGKEESWCVATSLVDAGEEAWNFREHICLEGTGDGGLAMWLPEIERKKMKMWKQKPVDGAEFETGNWKPSSSTTTDPPQTKKTDKLRAKCHCGGVEFYISRPQGEEAFKEVTDSLTTKDKSKWYGSIEVCNSCRLVSGCAILAWVFPLVSHLTLGDGSPYTPVFGTAKLYKSSDEVTRTFCGTCGAMVTYACNDRLQMVDVAAGLLEGNGARVEDWVEWQTDKVDWREDCAWKGMLKGLEEGLKKYGEEHSGGGEV